MGKVWVGTSGYSYQHWKEIFYPKGLAQSKWLEFYAQHFECVEINATFYRHFERHVFERWHDVTPVSFRFAIKGPKTITRDKRLEGAEEDLARFLGSAAGLGEKLGVILWQLPPSFKNDEEGFARLQSFIALLPANISHAFEFRHPSWVGPKVMELLDNGCAGWVSADSRRFVSAEAVTGGVGYYRYHGPKELYSSSYSAEAIASLGNSLRPLADIGDAYCFFNNDFCGYALENGKQLQQEITK